MFFERDLQNVYFLCKISMKMLSYLSSNHLHFRFRLQLGRPSSQELFGGVHELRVVSVLHHEFNDLYRVRQHRGQHQLGEDLLHHPHVRGLSPVRHHIW